MVRGVFVVKVSHRSIWHRVTLLAVGSSLLAGCGTVAAAKPAAPSSPVGNVAIVALTAQTSPNWWFPVGSSATFSDLNGEMNALMYKPLLYISRTDGIDYKRSLASSVTWNKAGTVYTIHLNPKWRWSDGKTVSAADVVWTTRLMLFASSSSASLPWVYGGAGIGGIPVRWKSVVAQGSSTVVVTLDQPSNPQWFLRNGLGQITPVPKSVWDKSPSMTTNLSNIKALANTPSAPEFSVIDGPFAYSAALSKPNSQYWTFVPNPHYDGHKASLKKLVFLYETSPSAVFADLKEGKANVGYLPFSLWSSRSQLSQDKMFGAYAFGFNYLLPNFSPKAPGQFGRMIQHRYVREALEMGIDQTGMVKTFDHGFGVVDYGPVPAKPHTQFYDANLKPAATFNVAKGKALLKSHGWKEVGGVMTKGTEQLAFTLDFVSGSDTVTDEVQLMKQDWAEEGIKVTLQSEPFDSLIANSVSSDPTKWQLIWWGGGWTYEPDYYPTGGGLFASDAASNSGGYSRPEMNALVKKTYEPGNAAEITQRLDAYQAYASQDFPVIWAPWSSTLNEVAGYLHGVKANFNPITDLNSPNYWTITQ